jgi:hypothetical protein
MGILSWIFSDKVAGRRVAPGGMDPHVDDPRDYLYAMLGGVFSYKPKHRRRVLPIGPVKDQMPNNTCVFHSYASSREATEGVALSPRSLVAYGRSKGYVRKDGRSTLREAQQAGMEWGIAEASACPDVQLPWPDYPSVPVAGPITESAARHRAKSYFWAKGKADWLKAIDDGNSIHAGLGWYSTYNMSGGLSSPWVLPWRRGVKVDEHAVCCYGYDLDLHGGVFIFRNSFGPYWGDRGDFYVRMADIDRDSVVGAVAVDMDGGKAAAMAAYHEGSDIKSDKAPSIWRIQDGKKRPYPDAATFYAWGGAFSGPSGPSFAPVAASLAASIPDGDPMKPEESPFWAALAPHWPSISSDTAAISRIVGK